METVAVCLYSKYSQRSKEFLDDIHPSLGIQMLCVDNEEVRQAIVRDHQGYHIKTVPCIFLFHSNGRLEKYEGSDAFTWLRKAREVMEANMYQRQQTPIAPSSPLPPQQTPIAQLQQPEVQIQVQQPAPPPVEEPQFVPEPQPLPMASPYEQVNNEPLDITPIDENGIQSLRQNNLPPQQNAEDIMNQEMELRRASDQVITRKQDNIKELAQMMQRQRESDDDKIAPPALYPTDQQNNRPPF